ncbi:BrnA antitoxin family protein [Methylobacterium currus]|uniref:BrnA antitoxin family protein n=1 Tax=Methylobacterium currus TaxID=2051553 RepID=UPI001E322934|nr:BrnA antitoxin family protein [Methylobacterium currus]UHC14428.1 BrnA antitoxin family protein [Methylobacterium currus]
MSASKRNTPPFFDEKTGLVDLAALDAHGTQAEEYDDLPDLAEADLDTADRHEAGRLVSRGRGRPKLDNPKRQVTLRLDADVIEGFRATGSGWQARINAILREALEHAER